MESISYKYKEYQNNPRYFSFQIVNIDLQIISITIEHASEDC